jgi:hypothetical protein
MSRSEVSGLHRICIHSLIAEESIEVALAGRALAFYWERNIVTNVLFERVSVLCQATVCSANRVRYTVAMRYDGRRLSGTVRASLLCLRLTALHAFSNLEPHSPASFSNALLQYDQDARTKTCDV